MRSRTIALMCVVAVAAATMALGGKSPATNSFAVAPEADREAILKAARDYADAFNKGDAAAIAAMWTDNAECREADGETIVGRTAIQKAYADFFAANRGVKLEVLVKSVRFPAKDLAVEEGFLRQSRGSKDLPTSTEYSAIHVREQGQWKLAMSSENSAHQDRIEDLDWLIGEWTTRVKNDSVKFTFAKDAKKPLIIGSFTRTAPGQEPATGSNRIAFDPETGHIRSWGFEDDGAHSQSLWTHDGKGWLLECRGVLANGTPFSEVIVLQKVDANAITWRHIDRMAGDEQLPDTPPMRLMRTPNK